MSVCVLCYSVISVIEIVVLNYVYVDKNYVRMGRDKVWLIMKFNIVEFGF